MSLSKFIIRILHLQRLLKISDVGFKNRFRELHLWVRPYKNGRRCPHCGHRGRILCAQRQERVWRDLPLGWVEVFFHYVPREILCRTHGRVQEEIPWARPHSRETHRFEYLVLRYCRIMTQQAAAELLRIPASTLSDLLHRLIVHFRQDHSIRSLRVLGVDEMSYKKGHRFATVVYDLARSKVVWIGDGKGRETIDRFFRDGLSSEQRKRVQFAACDMSATYIGAILDHCPQAKLVLDRFHIVKSLNAAVDEVRKEQWRAAAAQDRKVLKGLRWLLYRHSSNRTKGQTRILNDLQRGNIRIHRAWVLKDEFEHFWDYSSVGHARNFIKRWCTSALRSRLEPLRQFVQTLRKYEEHILTFVETGLTNAVAEGVNRVIRMVKNRASGFSSLAAFSDLIFLTIGDVDILGKFPNKFRIP